MLEVKSLSKTYGEREKKIEAIKGISLKVKKGEFVALVGPSGCGKSTLLRCIAGLIEPNGGKILLNKKESKKVKDKIGMIFQHFSSFPWLTVKENIEFSLNLKKISKKIKKEIVDYYLAVTGLKDFADVYPKDLSGGMKQRVAIAMTLADNPELILMDEPFSSLDSQTKSLMQELFLNIWDKKRTTVLFVTHDIDEAIFLADRIYVMSTRPGKIKEEIKVNLKRPRDIETKLTKEFLELKKHIHYLIRGESIKAAQLGLIDFGKDIIKIGLHTWAGITPFYYAKEKGYFKEEGMDVELVGLEKEEDRVEAFIRGDVDLLHLTVDSIHYLKEIKNIDCDIAMLIDNSIGGDALVSVDSINSVGELKGKKIGVERNLFSHFFLVYLLNKNGLKSKDVDIVFLKSSDIGSNFLKGKIDAAILWEPWLSYILKITNTKILISTKEEKDKVISALFAKKNFIKNHKEELQKLENIWNKVILELKKDRNKLASKLSPYIGLSDNDFKLQINKLEFIWKKNKREYEKKVKKLILESEDVWKLIKD